MTDTYQFNYLRKLIEAGEKRKFYEIIQDSRINIDARNYRYETLLIKYINKHAFVKMLVDRGADVNARDNADNTPLHSSLDIMDQDNCIRTTKILLHAGADVNAKNNILNEPLHVAAANDNHEALTLLISKGARLNDRNMFGESPLFVAVQNNNYEAAKLLIENGAKTSVKNLAGLPLLQANLFVRTDRLNLLLIKNTTDLNVKGPDGLTLLHLLVTTPGNMDLIELLVRRGANINVKDNEGLTPLHIAILNDQYDAVKYLLGHGADPKIVDNRAFGPFREPHATRLLEIAKQNGDYGLIQIFLENGAHYLDDGPEHLVFTRRSPDDICVICQESLRDRALGAVVKAEGCGHYFHAECIRDWTLSSVSTRYQCPTCRTHLFGSLRKKITKTSRKTLKQRSKKKSRR
jgi:ankyrin repeat protein